MSINAVRQGTNQAIGVLQDVAINYRSGTTGTWLPFPFGVLNTDPPVPVGWDEDDGGEVQMHSGQLVCRQTSPVLSIGDQLQDWQGQVWAVLGVDRSVAAVLYRLRREILSDAAYDRKRGGRE